MATRTTLRSPRPPPQPTAQRPRWVSRAAWLGVALGLVLGPGTPLGTLLILAGVGALVGDGLTLISPRRGPRTAYGVRYHADALTADQAAALGRALTLLAGVGDGALTVTWLRHADLVTCHIRTPPGSVPALTRILAYFLPELRLEPLPGVPALLAGAGWYVRRWPRSADAAPALCDAAAWSAAPEWAGDGRLDWHFGAAGGAVLVQGRPTAGTALPTGFVPLWPLLWRWAGPDAGAALLRRAVGGLFRHYPGFAPWPDARPPAVQVVPTGSAATIRLDTQRSLQVALPADYTYPPPAQTPLCVGVSSADGRALGVAVPPGRSLPSSPGHFLALGGDRRARGATVTACIQQAVATGWGVIYLDPNGDLGPTLAGRLGGTPRWIDLDNPTAGLRLNLLAVPAGAGHPSPAVGEAAALVAALTVHLPLLGSYLTVLGVPTWGGAALGQYALDAAATLLLRHRRYRLTGQAWDLPPLDLALLSSVIGHPTTLDTLLQQEVAAWATPGPDLAAGLQAAGAAGVAAAALAGTTTGALQTRWTGQSAAVRRMRAADLGTRLRPALDHPALIHLWRGSETAPTTLIDTLPPPLVLTRLPTRQGTPADIQAARWYGAYLLTCLIAAAQVRTQADTAGPPILLVIEDYNSWDLRSLLPTYLPILAQGGIQLLLTSAALPPAPGGRRLLDGCGTWWIHNLDPADRAVVLPAVQAAGLTADLPLTQLPTGITLVQLPTPNGPVLATAYTDWSHIRTALTPAEGGEAPRA